MLKHTTPQVTRQAEEILSLLRKSSYFGSFYEPGLVHGDFYHGQILMWDKNTALLDFDRSHIGDVAMDIGNFCAHLRLLRIYGLVADDSLLESAFVGAYERASGERLPAARLNFWTAFSLFQLGVEPFRRLEPSWPEKTERIISQCRQILTQT